MATAEKPLVVFEAAPPGKAVEVGFFYSRETADTLENKFFGIGTPWFYFDQDNGEKVWVVVREADFDPAALPSAEEINRSMAMGGVLCLDAFPEVGAERGGLTAAFWTSPKDGEALRLVERGGITMRRNR